MARIRTIKPQFFRSADVAELPSDACRITWVGLWTYCDDAGRGLDDARLVKGEIWPLHDRMTAKSVESHLVALASAPDPLICRYEIAGRRYLHVVNWKRHQKINRPQPSQLPACPHHDPSDPTHDLFTERSVNRNGSHTDHSRQEKEGNKERNWKKEGIASSVNTDTQDCEPHGGDDDGPVGQALRKLARQDYERRLREVPDRPVYDDLGWLRRAIQNRRIKHADQLSQLPANLDADAIVARLSKSSLHPQNRERLDCADCEGAGMIESPVGCFRCPSCNPGQVQTA